MNQEIELNTEDIEINLVLEAIFQKYGYDFREYSRAHIKRRLKRLLDQRGIPNFSEMIHSILHDKSFFDSTLLNLSINVTEMFRDPSFFQTFRSEITPFLQTWPSVKIWHAGCATGEEAYSLAIVLKEENILSKTQIYATDFNQRVLKTAKEGIYSLARVKEFSNNYQKAGGNKSLSDYFTAKYDSILFDNSLRKKIVFADHNMVTDTVFGEMQVIVCRNVLIYFSKDLQDKTIRLFHESLCPGGFLCLGSKESLRFCEMENHFEQVVSSEQIYQKKCG